MVRPDHRPSSTGSSGPPRRGRPSSRAAADKHSSADTVRTPSIYSHSTCSHSNMAGTLCRPWCLQGPNRSSGPLTQKGLSLTAESRLIRQVGGAHEKAQHPTSSRLWRQDKPVSTTLYCPLRAGHNHVMSLLEPTLQPTSAPALPEATLVGGVLTIDLSAIEANWKRLAGMTLPVECAAVVKGDGYGCGLEPVTAKLYKAGCRTFFVADIPEGRRARGIAPDATIYVL